jgi:hypothetical protein
MRHFKQIIDQSPGIITYDRLCLPGCHGTVTYDAGATVRSVSGRIICRTAVGAAVMARQFLSCMRNFVPPSRDQPPAAAVVFTAPTTAQPVIMSCYLPTGRIIHYCNSLPSLGCSAAGTPWPVFFSPPHRFAGGGEKKAPGGAPRAALSKAMRQDVALDHDAITRNRIMISSL